MVAVSAFDLFAGAQVNAQGGAEERGLDIVGDDGVATEDNLSVVSAYQLCHVTTGSGVNDGWAKHKEYLAVIGPCLLHALRHLMNCQHFNLLRGDITLHEGEGFAITFALERAHANAVVTNRYFITAMHFVHWFAVGATVSGIDDNDHVHLDSFDIDPLPVQAHLRGEIGGGVEACRQYSILLNSLGLHVFGVDEDRAELLKFREDTFEYLVVGGL